MNCGKSAKWENQNLFTKKKYIEKRIRKRIIKKEAKKICIRSKMQLLFILFGQSCVRILGEILFFFAQFFILFWSMEKKIIKAKQNTGKSGRNIFYSKK
jgi:hypothetical protein